MLGALGNPEDNLFMETLYLETSGESPPVH